MCDSALQCRSVSFSEACLLENWVYFALCGLWIVSVPYIVYYISALDLNFCCAHHDMYECTLFRNTLLILSTSTSAFLFAHLLTNASHWASDQQIRIFVHFTLETEPLYLSGCADQPSLNRCCVPTRDKRPCRLCAWKPTDRKHIARWPRGPFSEGFQTLSRLGFPFQVTGILKPIRRQAFCLLTVSVNG